MPIINDTVVEQKESFLLNLFSPTNAVIGNSSAVATIIDNDGPSGTPVMSIGDRVVDEFAGVVTFAVTLDRPSVGTVNVNYATAPGTAGTTDYGTTSGALTFAPGEMVKTVSVPIVNDAVAEGDEKFDLVLSSPVGATLPDPRGTALIEANDQTPVATPVISVDKVMVGENAGFVDFVVRLNAPSNSVTVSYKDTNLTAVSGSDYDAVNGTLKFAPGETVKTVRVPIINDTTVEPDETFAFTLSSPVNATIAAGSTNVTATIVDDDTAPVLAYGASNDTYVVSQSATRIIEAPTGGIDLARSSVTYTLPVNVENLTLTGGAPINGTGNAGNNVITGNSGNNVLSGLGGVDTVSYATAAAGVTVSLALTTPQNTGGAGTDTLSGFENLTGSNFADNLTGSSAANVINGGAGTDMMSGGAGNDIYYVDNAADKVNEAAGQGTDTVYASVSYALTGWLGDRVSAGECRCDRPYAHRQCAEQHHRRRRRQRHAERRRRQRHLNGGAGADVMAGGTGNDIYYVDNVGDVVNEAAGAGTDTVRTTLLSKTLGSNLENLAFIGSGNFTGTGNALNNIITGGAGNDTLNGGAGNDVLNGGAGADVMAGGTGNDIYYVDHAGDVTNEAAGAGTDTVRTTLLSKTLSANLENLAFIGSGNFTGTGNTLNNAITGGAGNDTLSGGAGNDGLTGGTGLDSFLFNQPLNALTNIDNILDFSVVDDTVLLSHLVFTALGPVGALPAGEFFTGASAGDAGDRIIYNSSTGALSYNSDGTGAAAPVQFAHLTPGLALTNSDFRVV